MQQTSEWRPVVGYEADYRVSDMGQVWSRPRARTKGGISRWHIGTDGYPRVVLGTDLIRVHLVVAVAFLGSCPVGCEVRHLDGNKLNPALTNLAYGSRSENMADTVKHGQHANARKTHCPQGHAYDVDNTKWYDGRRYCRACKRDRHP